MEKNTKLRKKLTRKALPIVVAVIMVFTLMLMPMSVSAAYDDWSMLTVSDYDRTHANDIALGQQTAYGAPGPDARNIYNLSQQWKKFTVTAPSVITAVFTAPANPDDHIYYNEMIFQLYEANGTKAIYQADGSTDGEVSVKGDVLQRPFR